MSDENYIDYGYNEETDKEGIQIVSSTTISLNAPEVFLSPDTPLLTKAQDVAGAINELFNEGGGGGDDDDWQPPESWREIPEPKAGQIIFLVEVTEAYLSSPTFAISLGSETSSIGDPDGTETIDWGDGYTDVFISPYGYTYAHIYSEPGLYIVKINTSEKIKYLYISNQIYSGQTYINGVRSTSSRSSYVAGLRAAKFGSDTGISQGFGVSSNSFTGLVYVKFLGEPKVNSYGRGSLSSGFYNCTSLVKIECSGGYPKDGVFGSTPCFNCQCLRKADFTKNFTTIQNGAFQGCYALEEIDLSSTTSITSAFNQCYSLREINAPLATQANGFNQCYSLSEIYTPLVTSFSGTEFNQCYNLQKIIAADGCNFNGNQFTYNPQLYPKPQ